MPIFKSLVWLDLDKIPAQVRIEPLICGSEGRRLNHKANKVVKKGWNWSMQSRQEEEGEHKPVDEGRGEDLRKNERRGWRKEKMRREWEQEREREEGEKEKRRRRELRKGGEGVNLSMNGRMHPWDVLNYNNSSNGSKSSSSSSNCGSGSGSLSMKKSRSSSSKSSRDKDEHDLNNDINCFIHKSL